MHKKLYSRIYRLISSGLFQTFIGFISFLVIAAVLMLFLESSQDTSEIKDLFNSLWFSIVTVTTVGYGDLSPISPTGKVAAIVIMFIGIIYIGILTGSITSWLVERNRKKILGLVPVRKKEGHFLILGWREGMDDLLKDVMSLLQQESSHFVLVNNVSVQQINDLKRDHQLKDISFLSGDHTSTEVLQNANALNAGKALIVSDTHSGKTAEETDFISILATVAVKRINPKIYTIVEITEPDYLPYLTHVDVEEIVLNRFGARAYLSNLALMEGFNNVFRQLFSMNQGILRIKALPPEYIGETYSSYRSSENNAFVIGLLENTGNLRKRKQEKMEQIQKSASIQKAIGSLMELKRMESNVPVFHPPPDYIIRENSAAIVLDTPPGELNNDSFFNDLVAEQESPISQSGHEALLGKLKKAIAESDSWFDFLEKLDDFQLSIFLRDETPKGVIADDRRHTFKALGLPEKDIESIRNRFESRSDIKEKLRYTVNHQLRVSSDWNEFRKALSLQGIGFYSYRGNINGVMYGKRKFSFKTLNIADPVIAALQADLDLEGTTQSSPTDRKKPELDGLSLYDQLMGAKQTDTVLGPKMEETEQILMICGWKPQLIEMLKYVVKQSPMHNVKWNRISVVANVDDGCMKQFRETFGEDRNISFFKGKTMDAEVLRAAGVEKASKVVLVAETDCGKPLKEIDSTTVLAAMMVGRLNKRAYKIAEILDSKYRESLEQANVEEIFLEDEFSRIMLANGSHGLGITKVLSEMINLSKTAFEIAEIDKEYTHSSFRQVLKELSIPGKLILGIVEETGNIYARKSERIHQAQVQSNIREQVLELVKVKDLVPNRVVIAPKLDYRIVPNSRLIFLNSSKGNDWKKLSERIH